MDHAFALPGTMQIIVLIYVSLVVLLFLIASLVNLPISALLAQPDIKLTHLLYSAIFSLAKYLIVLVVTPLIIQFASLAMLGIPYQLALLLAFQCAEIIN